jgi:hypothetical protein
MINRRVLVGVGLVLLEFARSGKRPSPPRGPGSGEGRGEPPPRLNMRNVSLWIACLIWVCASTARAAAWDPAMRPLLTRSFFEGREYFALRGGRAEMIIQADRADLAPAFLYLLFDAQNNGQSARKDRAFNFGEGQGFVNSALEVTLGGFAFTAVGHETRTRWVLLDGIPAVEAVWWAGGLRVTEHLFAAGDQGLFIRRVTLSAADLGGTETVRVRCSLPPGANVARDGWLTQTQSGCRLALGARGGDVSFPNQTAMEIGPLTVAKNQTLAFDTFLAVRIDGEGEPAPLNPEAALESTRAQWAKTSTITTEDKPVRELFDKARFGLAGMVADNGVMNAGIFEYGAQWVRDTSNTLLGMVHAGHFELARQGFRYVLERMVNAEGNAMIAGGFDDPDREQFDQMGELLHALKAYRDWTGDDSVVRAYRTKLVPLIERPGRPEFRDATGMVHNRREFWERTLDDAYELAYQTYVTQGWRDAAALAEPLGAEARAPRWRAEAERTLQAMLNHPSRALVERGRLIKRRNVTGAWVRDLRFPAAAADVPLKTEQTHLAEPDATMALPIALGLVSPRSSLARHTLDELERIHHARWFGGGYERYHSSGQCDQPGPWSFATCFILRAQHEAGMWERSRRTLEWLNTECGGRAGAWFEEIPLVRSQAATSGILPWTSGEISLFCVRHWLGVRFEGDTLVIQPALYPGSPPVSADLRYRQGRLRLRIDGAGPIRDARLAGRRLKPDATGDLRLPVDFSGGTLEIRHR